MPPVESGYIVFTGIVGLQRGRVMNKALISCISLLSALVVFESAKADEDVVKPRRERAAAPARVAPQRAAPTQTSNWSGGQVGGSNGVSSVNNNFVEPGAFICPFGSSFGSNCFETPFQFSGHKAAYTIGPFVGYRVQLGAWVVGLEGDWSYKNSETSLNQSSSTSIAVSSFSSGSTITSNHPANDAISLSVCTGTGAKVAASARRSVRSRCSPGMKRADRWSWTRMPASAVAGANCTVRILPSACDHVRNRKSRWRQGSENGEKRLSAQSAVS